MSAPAHCAIGLTALAFLSNVLWALGYPEQARIARDAALQHDDEQKHFNTSAHVRIHAGAQLAQVLRDVIAARNHADAVIALADQHALPAWHAHAAVFLGWALGQDGCAADAITLVQRGLASFDAIGGIGHRI